MFEFMKPPLVDGLKRVIVYTPVVPEAVCVTVGVLVVLMIEGLGMQAAPAIPPGRLDAVVAVLVTPKLPSTEPNALLAVVVIPCAPPVTVSEPAALER
jgi:hypothetical protein